MEDSIFLPKFIGIGAPRSGTRWLAQCLTEHPQIAMPPGEIYYFTTRRIVNSYYSRGLQWYSDLFKQSLKPDVKTWGEITPVYLYDEDTPFLMHQCVPDAKLICCLRDQSERAYSWYRFFLKVYPEIFNTNYSFRAFLTYHTEVYGREGFYLEHLQRYLALYPRKSIMILLYDDLEREPGTYLQQVYRFLGVDDSFVPPSLCKQINPTSFGFPRSNAVNRIVSKMRTLPYIGLFSNTIEKINTRHFEESEMPERHRLDSEMRVRIEELYRDHNKKLGDFLYRDLSHWNREKIR